MDHLQIVMVYEAQKLFVDTLAKLPDKQVIFLET